MAGLVEGSFSKGREPPPNVSGPGALSSEVSTYNKPKKRDGNVVVMVTSVSNISSDDEELIGE